MNDENLNTEVPIVVPEDFILVGDELPPVNKTVQVIMSDGVKTVGYFYDNWQRSGWKTNTGNGLFANQIWSGIKVIAWK